CARDYYGYFDVW
nr:immunoglobulin heavy chain junction region [Mus musculus]